MRTLFPTGTTVFKVKLHNDFFSFFSLPTRKCLRKKSLNVEVRPNLEAYLIYDYMVLFAVHKHVFFIVSI